VVQINFIEETRNVNKTTRWSLLKTASWLLLYKNSGRALRIIGNCYDRDRRWAGSKNTSLHHQLWIFEIITYGVLKWNLSQGGTRYDI